MRQLTDIANTPFAKVIARVATVVGDGGDEDRSPDFYAAAGEIIFTPNISFGKISKDDQSTIVLNEPVRCHIDPKTGYMIGPDGNRGVNLIATSGNNVSPDGLGYTVSFVGDGSRIPDFGIYLRAGTVVDLATVVPVDLQPGIVTTVSTKTVEAVEQALINLGALEGKVNTHLKGIPSMFRWDGATLVINGDRGPDLRGVAKEEADIVREMTDKEVKRMEEAVETLEKSMDELNHASQILIETKDQELKEALAVVKTDLSSLRSDLVKTNNNVDVTQKALEQTTKAAAAAEKAALVAAGIADEKGKVIYSETEPPKGDQKTSNLWVVPSTEETYIWTGSKWEHITSKGLRKAAQDALDAKKAAEAAANAAEQAKAEAAAALAVAVAAQTTADQAVLDARDSHNASVIADEKAEEAAKAAEAARRAAAGLSLLTNGDMSMGDATYWDPAGRRVNAFGPEGTGAPMWVFEGGTVDAYSEWFKVGNGRHYLVDFWVKSNKTGSILAIEMNDRNGRRPVSRTPLEAGSTLTNEEFIEKHATYKSLQKDDYLSSGIESPTPWTRYRTIILSEIDGDLRFGSWAFNHKSGEVTDAIWWIYNLSVYDVTEAVNATKAAQKAIDEAKRLADAAAADSKKASDAAIAEVNKARIEAQNAANAAKAEANNAKRKADSASSAAATAQQKAADAEAEAAAAKQRAFDAETKATKAKADAELAANNAKIEAQKASNAAKSEAAAAKQRAAVAEDEAIAAKQWAAEAEAEARTAKAEANKAKSKAESAKTEAANARAAATTAKTAADAASEKARKAQQAADAANANVKKANEEIAKNKLALDNLDAYTRNLWENTKLSLDRIGARSILTNGNFEIDDKKYWAYRGKVDTFYVDGKKVKAWTYSRGAIEAYTETFNLEADRYYMVDMLIYVDKTNTRLYVELRDSDWGPSIEKSRMYVGDERTISDVILAYVKEELSSQGKYIIQNRTMRSGWLRHRTIFSPTISDSFAFANWSFNHHSGAVTDATYRVTGLKLYDVTDAVLVAQQVVAESSEALEAAYQADSRAQTALNQAKSALGLIGTTKKELDEKITLSANAKNAITWSFSQPSTPGVVDGDTHFQIDSNYNVFGQWTWKNKAWRKSLIKNEVLASLDVSKLTAGTAAIQKGVVDKLYAAIITTKFLLAEKIITEKMLVDGVIKARHLDIVPQQGRGGLKLNSEGLMVVDKDGLGAIDLRVNQENYISFFKDDSVTFSVTDNGDVSAQTLSVTNNLYYNGVELSDILSALPRGVIASNYNSSDTMKVAADRYYRLSFVVLEKPETNRWYKVVFSAGFKSAGSRTGAHLVLVSNPGRRASYDATKTHNQHYYDIHGFYWDHRYFVTKIHSDDLNWNSDGECILSVFARNTIQDGFYVRYSVNMIVEDMGPAFNDTMSYGESASNSSPATPSTPATSTRTTTWNMSSFQNYNRGSRYRHTSGNIAGGYYDGEWRGIMLFPYAQIQSALRNSRVSSIQLYLENAHTHGSSGSTVLIGSHNYASAPRSGAVLSSVTSISFGRGQAKWVPLPGSVATGFANGTIKGLGVYGSSYNNYALFRPGSVKLRATYTK